VTPTRSLLGGVIILTRWYLAGKTRASLSARLTTDVAYKYTLPLLVLPRSFIARQTPYNPSRRPQLPYPQARKFSDACTQVNRVLRFCVTSPRSL
jgi:hypothetical protein